jgi:hypothetical protein
MDLSPWLADIVIVVLAALAAALVHFAIQRSMGSRSRGVDNDVAGFLFSVVGVLYAVVLGFVVIVAWEKYDQAGAYVEDEIAAISDLYRTAAAFPEPVRVPLRHELETYVHVMNDAEWPAMTQGQFRSEGITVLERIAHRVTVYNPTTPGEIDAHQIALSQVQRFVDARRHRVHENMPSIPGVLWFALIAGGIGVLIFAYLFAAENWKAQLVMTGLLASVIATLFIVIVEFDYPFRGAAAIAPQGWGTIHARLHLIQ